MVDAIQRHSRLVDAWKADEVGHADRGRD